MASFSLTDRKMTHEIMDSPGLSPAQHIQALEGLRRINRISDSGRNMAGPILEFAQKQSLRNLKILDVACGGGDVPTAVAQRLKRRGINAEFTLLDASQTALQQAQALAQNTNVQVQTICGDALRAPIEEPFDVVINSLFLHHLPHDAAIAMLVRMRELTRHLVVISDLRRSYAGFTAAWIGCRLLCRSPIVHHDGPVSVRAAWTIDELRELAAAAGMSGASIRRCRPWRMLLVWEKK
jgi:2-polyprenyl-3-methyl-5-hydroxy-6-metoxy-1,4-benzoquinol methylase